MNQLQFFYSLDYCSCRQLERAAQKYGADLREIAALGRLQSEQATHEHLQVLRRLAFLADLPWDEMYPDLRGGS